MSWPVRSLAEFMLERGGSTDPSKSPEREFALYSIPAYDAGIPEFVRGSEIGSSKKNIQTNDVLLSRIVPHIRRSWIVGKHDKVQLIGSSEWIVFRDQRFFPPFLRHFLLSDPFHSQFMQTVAGVGGSLLRARPEYVGKIEIPLPPLDEQRRIAAILDKADQLRQKRKLAIKLLDSLTQSIFLEMFGDTEISWPIKGLRDVVRDGTLITYGIVQAGEEFSGGVPYIRTGDIKDGEISLIGLRHTDPEIASRFKRSQVQAGEIVMSIRATVGTTACVPMQLSGANLTQGTARIAPGPAVTTEYLLYYLRSRPIQSWIEKQVKGATFREITLSRLRELQVVIPPLRLQDDFSMAIQVVRRQKTNAEAAADFSDFLFASLQHRAFSGQL